MSNLDKYAFSPSSPLRQGRIVERLREGNIISEEEVRELCFLAREILLEEGNVQRVDAPVTVLAKKFHLDDDILVVMWRYTWTIL